MTAQTRIDSGAQIRPRLSIVMAQFSNCTGQPNCAGLSYAVLKFSDGTSQTYFLVPPNPPFTPDSNWTSVPVSLPIGPTSITCSQTKP